MSGGGTEKIAMNLKSSLTNRYDIDFVTLYDKMDRDYDLKYTTIVPNISSQIIRVLIYPYAVIKFLYHRIIVKSNLVISMDAPVNIINLITSILGFKSIVSLHVMPEPSNHLLSKISDFFLFSLLKITKQDVVVVSNGVRDELLSRSGYISGKVHLIYNPIDINSIENNLLSIHSDQDAPSIIQNHQPYIITVARLSQIKAIQHIIRAFSKLCHNTSINLMIVGDGPEKDYLEDLAKKMNCYDKIVFLGWKDNPYIYIQQAQLFVLSSISEALPNVIVESMVCGCPVVSANCSSGIGELLGRSGVCGLIAEKISGIRYGADDPIDEGEQSLLSCMETILSDADLREKMSVACKERAKLFELDVGIQKYVELIENVIKK